MMTDVNQTYNGDYSKVYTNLKSLYCAPETNIMLYVNYTSIKINTNQNPVISNESCVDLTTFGNEHWMMDDLRDD